ncbi:hypothetical protein [Haliangium ochraceum]|uniref:Uncharacterized protein n=1 Tax=Haliangium ochraceum (strain DSM 14365 / JCM 11303 / SMP-2) TaxID=502025 RepID=D0LPJ0_HALO1|nr:hypothetical protein Hoch_2829 [Haliangium ochraceum DSM 14365]
MIGAEEHAQALRGAVPTDESKGILLRQRFGELSIDATERLGQPAPDQLGAWSQDVVASEALDQVLA